MPSLIDTPNSLIKSFVKSLRGLDTSKDNYTKFRDFLTLAYCAYAKTTSPPQRAEELEAEYMRVVGTYANKDDIRQMPEMISQVYKGVQLNMDFLGCVAGELELLNADAGQFFTPYEVSKMMAMLNLDGIKERITENGYVTVSEPACGAGSMVLALADVLTEEGFDPGLTMWVEATDVAEMPFKMTFLQLAFRGVAGRVYRANSLALETFETVTLPASHRFIDTQGFPFAKDNEKQANEAVQKAPVAKIGEQMMLF